MKGSTISTSVWDSAYNGDNFSEFVIVGQVVNIKPGMWVGSDKCGLCKHGKLCPTLDACPYAHPYDPNRNSTSPNNSKPSSQSDSGSTSPSFSPHNDNEMENQNTRSRALPVHHYPYYPVGNQYNTNNVYMHSNYPPSHQYNNTRKNHISSKRTFQKYHVSPAKVNYKYTTEA